MSNTAVPFTIKQDKDTIYIRFDDGGVTIPLSSWTVPSVTFPANAIGGEIIGFRVQPIYKNSAPGREKIGLPQPLFRVGPEGYEFSDVKEHPPIGIDGPTCLDCGGMTQRTGACYTCVECGGTTGCG